MNAFQTRFWSPEAHPAIEQTLQPLRIVRGDGCYLYDDAGNELVDASSGLWTVAVGHNRREIKQAIAETICNVAREHGALPRPMGSIIVAAPPLVAKREHLDKIVQALAAGLPAQA
jgi:adenosylmethionine-8-amino-7-oxononanoate aminotransferase